MDSISERVVQDVLKRLRGSVTIIVIAHRLSTVDAADQVIVLHEGQVVERGRPDWLASACRATFVSASCATR